MKFAGTFALCLVFIHPTPTPAAGPAVLRHAGKAIVWGMGTELGAWLAREAEEWITGKEPPPDSLRVPGQGTLKVEYIPAQAITLPPGAEFYATNPGPGDVVYLYEYTRDHVALQGQRLIVQGPAEIQIATGERRQIGPGTLAVVDGPVFVPITGPMIMIDPPPCVIPFVHHVPNLQGLLVPVPIQVTYDAPSQDYVVLPIKYVGGDGAERRFCLPVNTPPQTIGLRVPPSP